MNPCAWLVVAADGFKAVFIDEASAMRYATHCHGLVYPLGVIHASAKQQEQSKA